MKEEQMSYLVERYSADGHGRPQEDTIIARNVTTLEEARALVRKALGVTRLSKQRKWGPWENMIEGYHDMLASEKNSDGCGGVAIVLECNE
jgi:hypothetical protein